MRQGGATALAVLVGLTLLKDLRQGQVGVRWWIQLVLVLLLVSTTVHAVLEWRSRARLARAPGDLAAMTVAPEVHTTHHRLVGATGEVWDVPWSGVHATTGQQVWVTPLAAGRPCFLVVPGAGQVPVGHHGVAAALRWW